MDRRWFFRGLVVFWVMFEVGMGRASGVNNRWTEQFFGGYDFSLIYEFFE